MIGISYHAKMGEEKMYDRFFTSQFMQHLLPKYVPLAFSGGTIEGNEYHVKNPKFPEKDVQTREIKFLKVNIQNGSWFIPDTGERGYDIVSLHAYFFGITISKAICELSSHIDEVVQGMPISLHVDLVEPEDYEVPQ